MAYPSWPYLVRSLRPHREQCAARTHTGQRCRHSAQSGRVPFCGTHATQRPHGVVVAVGSGSA
jgi:hypothetical protein